MQPCDLNLLAALDALLEHGSVTGAADALGVSPSAMSRTLSRIRRQTGDPILARAGRKLVPTPHAVAIRERVRATLEATRALLGPDDPDAHRTRERTLTIRADDSVVAAIGPGLIERAGAERPGLTLVFCSEGSEDVSCLREGRVDLDIGVQGPLGPEVRVSRLLDDERRVIVRRGGTRGTPRISLARYASAEHVDVSRRGLTRGPIDDLLEARGRTRRVRMVVPTQLAAAVVVAQSELVSLVSARFAAWVGALLPVEVARPPVALEKVAVAMAWHPRHDGDPLHAWLRDTVRALAQVVRARTGSPG